MKLIWKPSKHLPGRFSDTVESRIVSPTALMNAGPPVMAPSFWLVTSTTTPLLLPSSIEGYHFSNTWSAYSNASALLCKQITGPNQTECLLFGASIFCQGIKESYCQRQRYPKVSKAFTKWRSLTKKSIHLLKDPQKRMEPFGNVFCKLTIKFQANLFPRFSELV